MSRHRSKLLAVVVVLVVLLPACGWLSRQQQKAPKEPAQDFPFSFHDALGRKITVKGEPQKIVSLDPGVTEMLYAVGAGDQLVGVDHYSDYPQAASKLPDLGGLHPDYQKIKELGPDVVITPPVKSMVSKLEDQGLQVIAVGPKTPGGILTAIRRLGRMTGHRSKGKQEAGKLAQTLQQVRARSSKQQGDPPKVFYLAWQPPLLSAGGDTLVNSLIETAGGTNIAGNSKLNWVKIDRKAVAAANPGVIITAVPDLVQKLKNGKLGWGKVKAVQEGNVHYLPSYLINRPGPRAFKGLVKLQQLISPAGGQEQ